MNENKKNFFEALRFVGTSCFAICCAESAVRLGNAVKEQIKTIPKLENKKIAFGVLGVLGSMLIVESVIAAYLSKCSIRYIYEKLFEKQGN